MITSEAIQSVQSLYSKGVQSQDSRLRPRHIFNQLIRSRATLLVQKVNKKQQISQWDYMTLPCVEMVKASPHECPCIIPTGCVLLKSKYPLPRLITGIDGNAIQSVTSLDGSFVFDTTTFETNKYNAGNKYTAKKPQYYIYNNYLFITIVKQIRVIQVTALFDDPVEVWEFPSFCPCEDCCLDIYDIDFPLSNDKMETAIDMAAQKLLGIFVQMREDKNNDASDESGTQAMLHQPQSDNP